MEVESYRSARQNARMLLQLTDHESSTVYDHHVTLRFAPRVIVRIMDFEVPKLAHEFQELGQAAPEWFIRAVERVLRKRNKKGYADASLVKAAQLYDSDPALSKLVMKIVAQRTADELSRT